MTAGRKNLPANIFEILHYAAPARETARAGGSFVQNERYDLCKCCYEYKDKKKKGGPKPSLCC